MGFDSRCLASISCLTTRQGSVVQKKKSTTTSKTQKMLLSVVCWLAKGKPEMCSDLFFFLFVQSARQGVWLEPDD